MKNAMYVIEHIGIEKAIELYKNGPGVYWIRPWGETIISRDIWLELWWYLKYHGLI